MLVNDRSVSVLENYDFEVIRTQKSRNAILCETNKGWYILKEYKGPVFRLEMMAKVLEGVRQNGFTRAEQLLYTKEGALFCCDQEQNRCIVKSWPPGKRMQFKGWTGMPGCYAHPGGSAQCAAFSTAAAGVWAARSQPGRGI